MTDGQVSDVKLRIYEPPRFFEALLRGRDFREVPDITARICGICPVAYQMGSCHALEKALGVFDQIDPAIRRMRTLLYCGEWIESHVLHIFMLHLPDFLGYESAITMARDHGPVVRRALQIKKLGNEIVTALAGRSVHPVGVCVGGFYRALEPATAALLHAQTRQCLQEMRDLTMTLLAKLSFPTLERDYEFLSLVNPTEYPMNLGRICSTKGLDIDQSDFLSHVDERQVEHSTALHAVISARGSYMVGPLARLNQNAPRLHPQAREILDQMIRDLKRPLPWRNNYLSILARAIETIHALATAEDILDSYAIPERVRIPLTPRAGVGGHGTEAPRGLCWHRYRVEADGTIDQVTIIPPTSQNQAVIEQDLRELAPQLADLSDEEAALRCEHLIRNYDPCISCSVHAVRLHRRETTP